MKQIYYNFDTRNKIRMQNVRKLIQDYWLLISFILKKYSDKDDIHKEDKPVILVTKPRARTCYVTCHGKLS